MKMAQRATGGLKPDVAQLIALFNEQRWLECEGAARKFVASHPREPIGWKVLGALLKLQGRDLEALQPMERAVALAPKDAEALSNLGAAYKALERIPESERTYRKALRLAPTYAEAWYNLGICLFAQDRFQEAESALQRAINLKPNYAQAYNNLGNALEAQGRFVAAREAFDKALAIAPEFAEAHCNKGNTLRFMGFLSQAEECYRRALQIKNDLPDAHHYLGYVLAGQQRFAEAEASYRSAHNLRKNFPDMLTNLGQALMLQGRYEEAEGKFQEAVKLDPDLASAQSCLLFYSNYAQRHSIEESVAAARRYGAALDKDIQDHFTQWNCASAPQKLRVGIVSGNLCTHPVGHFLEAMLSHLDGARIELVAYPTHYQVDDLTRRIQKYCAHWQPIYGLRDTAAANLIYKDAPHVLLDLAGHTGEHRLPLFARRLAPVQATWLGYFATTGVNQMDYVLGDPFVTPECESHHFTEHIWRLPETYLCFTPPPFPLSADREGGDAQCVFGCFNNLAKMTAQVVEVWAAILREVPTARLLLKTAQLTDAQVAKDVYGRFAQHGIDPARLMLEGHAPREQLLATYKRVDIALDPFPYPGGTTSVEALWMGVPVLTRKGDRFLSHVGETIAHNIGAREWIANDDADYIAKAKHWAGDQAALQTLRAELRNRLLASPLCNAPRFARHFEDALWGMWHATGVKRCCPQH